ncbi:hypothetical protein HOD75_00145 [archaeon]|jgi:hypothetical protein|nr:hypothetical protein [Candidatus Woesearchaeota archaeon]MBT4136062.1 hypothetical protein [archaeon]MBT4241287.1 hypothetical protein [archaeon]MBT4418109.1 hypothetical protein [archaeon]
MENNNEEKVCCPKFNPEKWDKKTVNFKDKKFIKERVRSLFHIPLNFGSVMKKSCDKIEKANAGMDMKDFILLSDENSLWGADIYLSVLTEVPGANNVKISGEFLTKVFEGSYKDMGKWVKEMEKYVSAKNKKIEKLYFYYTTCPKCAKKYGKNYVVILAKV